ncbi:hypothetical protein B0O99DRAFT_682293 [Bisporella sp. PMI_857]|nr:hypothetical protein B0O99DRAFT_682696 [Bisporella sp. PMI_857]KAH8600604.1 hypothetical protein B0O99DRAFT_682293 [Bisporella sp. PMI_857]
MSPAQQLSGLIESVKQYPSLTRIGSLFHSTDITVAMSKRSATFSSITVENGLHQAVALSAMTLLVTAHRAIMKRVGLITTVWTMLVILSGIFMGQRPCRHGAEVCLARLAYAPWMMQFFSLFWALAFVHEIFSIRSRDGTAKPPPGKDEESRATRVIQPTISRLLCSEWLRIWRMKCSRGPLDWSGSVDWKFRWILYGTMTLVVGVTTYGAVRTNLYTVGMLNLVGLMLFILGAGGANKYAIAPHMYTADMLRVVLETRHKEGTVYILPSRQHGFDAVWSPKIDYEHREVDEGSILSAKPHEVNPRKQGQIKNLDLRLAAFNSAVEITAPEVNCLATWLYTPASAPGEMRSIACLRAPVFILLRQTL